MYKLFPKTYMTKSITSTQFYMNFTFKVQRYWKQYLKNSDSFFC